MARLRSDQRSVIAIRFVHQALMVADLDDPSGFHHHDLVCFNVSSD
jgi:hypothetical protein